MVGIASPHEPLQQQVGKASLGKAYDVFFAGHLGRTPSVRRPARVGGNAHPRCDRPCVPQEGTAAFVLPSGTEHPFVVATPRSVRARLVGQVGIAMLSKPMTIFTEPAQ